MNEISEVIAELREIRSELKHLNERFENTIAHQSEVVEMRHAEHEKRLLALEDVVPKLEKKLVGYSAVITAVVVVSGFVVKFL
ncbi:MAG: hypothetical protein AAF975_02060 [Spirochaetota bacterium]